MFGISLDVYMYIPNNLYLLNNNHLSDIDLNISNLVTIYT